MIVIDTSALIAILRAEPEKAHFEQVIANANGRLVCAVSVFEAAMVTIGRSATDTGDGLDAVLEAMGVEIAPFDADLAAIARDAFIRFGKGSHPAGLNMGDCASYALAKSLDLPLLFKGDDFSRTDVTPALA
ncbi:type II toxin-antitoxin system VapC family toxin [Azospirillum sp.]|uniref:type II toxin-antitoxin system VapC family toxin n=1 Tax=Azospirillum sp. TaxID=34012 RepID=UPI003D756E1A